jgi:prevent-host-death family protein
MVRTVTATELRKSFSKLFAWMAGSRRNAIVVESRGKPVVVILPFEEYEHYLALKRASQTEDLPVELPRKSPIRFDSPHLVHREQAERLSMKMSEK